MTLYRTWMADTPQLHDRLLRNICLPASHDSGAYALSNELTADPSPALKEILDEIRNITQKIDVIPFISEIINPAAWVDSEARAAIKQISTATGRSIAQQLNDGIRCFDLRIAYDSKTKDFYCFHGLLGPRVSDVLQAFKDFLSTTTGEIVYITFGHWNGCDGQFDAFASLVENYLGEFAYQRNSGSDDNLFDQTYNAILNGSQTSRAILVNGTSRNPIFWPQSFSPPDNGKNGKTIAGYYSDTADEAKMMEEQKGRFQDNAGNLPFALYMTLTPSTEDSVKIVVSSLAKAIAALGAWVAFTPLFALAAPLEALAASLAIYNWQRDWTTLKELARKVDSGLTRKIIGEFQPLTASDNQITFIYVDYYEMTGLINLAIRYSGGTDVPINSFLWMGYVGEGGSNLYVINCDGVVWGSQAPVGGGAQTSGVAPALAIYQGKLWVGFVGEGGSNLYVVSYDGFNWDQDIQVEGAQTSGVAPALVVYQDKLWMCFVGKGGSNLYVVSYDGNDWGDPVPVGGGAQTNDVAPALATYQGKLWVGFGGKGGSNLYVVNYDGSHWDRDIQVAGAETNGLAPALAVYQDKLWMCFVGKGGSNLYVVSYDGNDWGDPVPVGGGAQTHNVAPALAAYQGKLWVGFVGEGGNNLYVVSYDGSNWDQDMQVGGGAQTNGIAPALAAAAL